MPTLNWIGKEAVENHHNEVPFRLLKRNNKLSVGEPDSGNLLVQGDNLEALKALLPYYAGQVKCIYIDPPYNTGNENWVYNDNVNSPEMKEWLGKVVGKDTDDLSRHDKWLCMMYPRLSLLKQFLREDGAIFISIDDNEVIHLRGVMDEIFGAKNFIAQISLLCNPKGRSQDKYFNTNHEYLLVYSIKELERGAFNVPKSFEQILKEYKEEDEGGHYRKLELRNTHREFSRENRPNLWYPLFVNPKTHKVVVEKKEDYTVEVWPYWEDGFEGCWTWGIELSEKDSHLLIAKKVKSRWKIYRKSYSTSDDGNTVKKKLFTIWNDSRFYTEKGQSEFGQIFPGLNKNDFPQPKSVDYIAEIIRSFVYDGEIILDSFAGSGTTGHALLKQNSQDKKNRNFILVEMMDYADSITSIRLKRVIEGYRYGENEVKGFGGGFSYCKLGQTLFDADGQIRTEVSYNELAQHVYFCETGEPLSKTTNGKSPLLGIHKEVAIYLLYNGILKDKKIDGGNVLTSKILAELPEYKGKKVIYGTACRFTEKRLRSENIVFKQTPYEIRIS